MHFTKIKYHPKKRIVSLAWTETKPSGDVIEHHLTSPDAPRPELVTAMRLLAPHAAKICECEVWGATLQPIGVSLSTGKDDEQGVVITCLRPVRTVDAPVVLNTPHVSEGAWPAGLYGDLTALEHEAERYIAGQRAQHEMFDAEEEDGEEAEDEDLWNEADDDEGDAHV